MKKGKLIAIISAIICLIIVIVSIIFFHKDIHILIIIFGGLGLITNLSAIIGRNKNKRKEDKTGEKIEKS